MAGLWTPGANFTRLFDLDRYFLNGSGDAVATEITDKAVLIRTSHPSLDAVNCSAVVS
jgi:hypothetical protein